MTVVHHPLRAAAWAALLACAAVSANATAPGAEGAQRPIPARTDQLIIAFKADAAHRATSDLLATAERQGIRLSARHRLASGAQVFKLRDGERDLIEVQRMARTLASAQGVAYAEADAVHQPMAAPTPNDPLWGQQWHYWDPVGGIRLPEAWSLSKTKGRGVVVAVIDTGYRPHADLAANVLPGYDFITDAARARDGDGRDADAQDEGTWTKLLNFIPIDSNWHGTHVAGTVAAVTHNGVGVAGVAPGAKVMPVRVLGKDGGYTSDIADAIIWASGGEVEGAPMTQTPARVINLSLGAKAPCETTLQSAIDGARSRGALVVVAAGNDSTDASRYEPANCQGVVAVAATGRNGGKAGYSNFGNIIDIAAPGGTTPHPVVSTTNTGKTVPVADSYGGSKYVGTSMAAPHVAGVAAMVMAKNKRLTPDQVMEVLQRSARAFPAPCTGCGVGLLDAAEALRITPAP